jgi:copper(I)-binding protein
VTAGQTVDLTLTFEDGSTKDVEAQVRDFSGNEENYDPGTTDMPMPQDVTPGA